MTYLKIWQIYIKITHFLFKFFITLGNDTKMRGSQEFLDFNENDEDFSPLPSINITIDNDLEQVIYAFLINQNNILIKLYLKGYFYIVIILVNCNHNKKCIL